MQNQPEEVPQERKFIPNWTNRYKKSHKRSKKILTFRDWIDDKDPFHLIGQTYNSFQEIYGNSAKANTKSGKGPKEQSRLLVFYIIRTYFKLIFEDILNNDKIVQFSDSPKMIFGIRVLLSGQRRRDVFNPLTDGKKYGIFVDTGLSFFFKKKHLLIKQHMAFSAKINSLIRKGMRWDKKFKKYK